MFANWVATVATLSLVITFAPSATAQCASPTVPLPVGDVCADDDMVEVNVNNCAGRHLVRVEDAHHVEPNTIVVTTPAIPEKHFEIGPFSLPPVHVDDHVIDVIIPGGEQLKRIWIGPVDPIERIVGTPGIWVTDAICVPYPL